MNTVVEQNNNEPDSEGGGDVTVVHHEFDTTEGVWAIPVDRLVALQLQPLDAELTRAVLFEADGNTLEVRVIKLPMHSVQNLISAAVGSEQRFARENVMQSVVKHNVVSVDEADELAPEEQSEPNANPLAGIKF